MGMISIFADGAALMIGSLLVSVLLCSLAWMAADRLHRPWAALVMLAIVVCGLLVSPLEQSLFVRMVSVFTVVGALLLSFVVLDRSVKQETAEITRARMPRHPRVNRRH
jgi:FtsH-binding integral membrane protein